MNPMRLNQKPSARWGQTDMSSIHPGLRQLGEKQIWFARHVTMFVKGGAMPARLFLESEYMGWKKVLKKNNNQQPSSQPINKQPASLQYVIT